MPAAPDTVVVGAGLSGLSWAWWARARGERVVVVEASDRAGGVIRTDPVQGYRIERSATTVPSGARALLALAAALPRPIAFRPAAEAARRQHVLARTGLRPVPRTPPALFTSPLLGPAGALRLVAESLRGPRRSGRSETLAAFGRRRFGQVALERLLRPFAGGVHAAAPERLGAADAFPRLVALEHRRGSVLRALFAERSAGRRDVLLPEGGMESIPRALAATLGVEYGRRVLDSVPRRSGDVVLAVPADAQAAIVRPFAPDVAEILDHVRYAPVAVVAVGFRRGDGPEPPASFGFLRGPGARVRILGATFLSRIDPTAAPEDRHLLNVFLGGTEDPGVLELSDDALFDVALRDVGRALGGRIRPELVQATRWPRAIPVLSPGHRARMARAAAALAPYRVRLLGSHVTGVGVAACAAAGAPPGELPAGLALA